MVPAHAPIGLARARTLAYGDPLHGIHCTFASRVRPKDYDHGTRKPYRIAQEAIHNAYEHGKADMNVMPTRENESDEYWKFRMTGSLLA